MAVELKSYSPSHTSSRATFDNQGFEKEDGSSKSIDSKDVKIDLPPETEDNNEEPASGYTRMVLVVQTDIKKFFRVYRKILIRIVKILLLVLYFAYFGYAMYYEFGDEGSIRLLVCTILGTIILVFTIVLDFTEQSKSKFYTSTLKPFLISDSVQRLFTVAAWLLKLAVAILLIVYIIIDVAIDHPQNLISVAGLAIYILLFYIFSVNPAKVNWHPVFWGIALQYIFALIILRQQWGFEAFQWLGNRVAEFLTYSDAGAEFLFNAPLEVHFFAFKVLPIIVFFYTIISIMYYLGVMQVIVRVIGRFLAFCMGTAPTESLNAAGNIFVGMTEAPLLISPFLKNMTKSELHAVMTGGFATIAGSVLGAYVSFGVPANHLISASVMSAPAALAISKLTYPEVEHSRSSSKDFYKMEKPKERNVIEAASNGATQSIKLVAAIAVNVLAFLSLLKFVNATLVWFGDRVGVDGFTLEFICSYVFFPIAYFMGTDVGDCRKVAELIGLKTFTNEFIAYSSLSKLIKNKQAFLNYTEFYNDTASYYWDQGNIYLNQTGQELVGGMMSTKSEVIATYALCGFSNFGSMGILLGGLGALAPSRKSDLSKLVVRAMVSGTVACFLTACVAGLLYKDY